MLNLALRYSTFIICTFLSIGLIAHPDIQFWVAAPFLFLSLVGIRDISQRKRSVRRNYPILGNLRYILESIRPEIRQYFLEGDKEQLPFSRAARSMVYRRARNISATKAFGTLDDVYDDRHEFIAHSIMPVQVDPSQLRLSVGGPDCKLPYLASILNISAMSFGSLSANAISALSTGAKTGNFGLDTGEGGISKYHIEGGSDLIFEIGSGYFGCRTADGRFDPDAFKIAACQDQVKMVEIKLSQGAKPGHGGFLPGPKVSKEIAITRGIVAGKDCISPARHNAFSNPVEMMEFISLLRGLSGGKPVGFKLCIGDPEEAAMIVQAMVKTQIYPDFIVIDGSEGGTGAAPEEFSDNIGMPAREGLVLMRNLLLGADLKQHVKLACSGKVISAFDIIRMLALGADWVNSARGFMFALGCIQSQSCGSDKCPTGIATQDVFRQRALDVKDKGQKVANFHKNTLSSVADILGAAGISANDEITAKAIMRRIKDGHIENFNTVYPSIESGSLIKSTGSGYWQELWLRAGRRLDAIKL